MMNASGLLLSSLLLSLLACEQDTDASVTGGGLPPCTHAPVHVLGGPFRPVRRDGFDPPRAKPGMELALPFEGEAIFEGLADGFATWAATSGAQPGPIRVPAGLLQPGTLYGIRYDFVPGPDPDPQLYTAITLDGRLVLFSVHAPLEEATEALAGVGLTARWVPTCLSSAGRTCYAPNTHLHLELTTGQGEVGHIPLNQVTTWISDVGTLEALLEAATLGDGPLNGCADIPHSEVWLTLRAIP